jgi:hypothetical protein
METWGDAGGSWVLLSGQGNLTFVFHVEDWVDVGGDDPGVSAPNSDRLWFRVERQRSVIAGFDLDTSAKQLITEGNIYVPEK